MPLELSYQQAEELLESVVSNKKLVKVTSRDGDRFVVLAHPSSDEILLSRHVREEALLEAIEEELPSREDVRQILEERGVVGTSEK